MPAERLLLASVKNTHLLATSFDVPRMRDFTYLTYADVAKGDYDFAMATDHANQANETDFLYDLRVTKLPLALVGSDGGVRSYWCRPRISYQQLV